MDEARREQWKEIVECDDRRATQLELLKLFLRAYPQDGAAWWLFGKCLDALARHDEAEDALRKAMELVRPQSLVYVLQQMGTLHQHKGDDEEAERWFRRAIENSPDDSQGYIYLGALLARLGRLTEAEEVHRRGTLCTQGCIDEAHYNLGLVLRALERYEEAQACFDKALAIDPQYKIARLAKRDVRRAIAIQSGGRAARDKAPPLQ